jgi:outer membrane protein OmpA-like peptidoglycan-associated protein
MNPVTWWHDLQGGKIAEERPPPPGADQPYPNLASVPPKPAQPDRAALTNITNALIADRANAQHAAAAAPIPDPSLPSASPGLFGRGTIPPPSPPAAPGAATASATLPAAEAPAAPGPESAAVPAPAKAPVGGVQSAPLAPPGATAQPPAAAAAPAPAMSAAPPPAPNLPGVPAAAKPPSPAWTVEPPPPPAAPAQVAAAASPAGTLNVTFVTGSATLSPTAADSLKQLAARRGNGVIAVTGYGEATGNDPDAQSAALALALSRAQAIAATLTSAGVPSSAVQVGAEAIGRGGSARLVQ